jgi:hypothetical protein
MGARLFRHLHEHLGMFAHPAVLMWRIVSLEHFCSDVIESLMVVGFEKDIPRMVAARCYVINGEKHDGTCACTRMVPAPYSGASIRGEPKFATPCDRADPPVVNG